MSDTLARLKELKTRLPASRFSGTTSLRYVYGEYRRLLEVVRRTNEANRDATQGQLINLPDIHKWVAGATKKSKGPEDYFDYANEAIESAVDELIELMKPNT